MRFEPETSDGANNGLKKARDRLESIKQKYPNATYADIWTLAGAVAVEEMAGPKIPWKAGRFDFPTTPPNIYETKDGKHVTRLPDALGDEAHVLSVFGRMGFNEKETVALIGAHCIGRCHTGSSGFSGPWTRAPTTFSNEFFRELVENKWTEKKWTGPKQYEDPTGQLMMLPADLVLLSSAKMSPYVKLYAKDKDAFFKDFADAFGKLLDAGVERK